MSEENRDSSDTEQENVNKNVYNVFHEFITDVAQIYYNAKLYNRRSSVIYSDACLNEVILILFGEKCL